MDDINMERSGSQITESGKLVNDGIELQVKAQMNSKMVRVHIGKKAFISSRFS